MYESILSQAAAGIPLGVQFLSAGSDVEAIKSTHAKTKAITFEGLLNFFLLEDEKNFGRPRFSTTSESVQTPVAHLQYHAIFGVRLITRVAFVHFCSLKPRTPLIHKSYFQTVRSL